MKRPHRHGEITCACGAYRFPHRMMGGACKGGAWVGGYFERELYGACRDCHLRDVCETSDGIEVRCQAIDGQEPLTACPGLAELVRFEGIRLYGMNKPPERAHGKR